MILNVFAPIGAIVITGMAIGFLTYLAFGNNIKDVQRCGD